MNVGSVEWRQIGGRTLFLDSPRRCWHGTTGAEDYIGYAEAWFDGFVPRIGPEGADAEAAALGAEQRFIDWIWSSFLVGNELVFVERDWL